MQVYADTKVDFYIQLFVTYNMPEVCYGESTIQEAETRVLELEVAKCLFWHGFLWIKAFFAKFGLICSFGSLTMPIEVDIFF